MSAELTRSLALIPQRVENGVEWLDENYPSWVEHVDAWSLNMANGNRCVLGQLAASPLAADRVHEFAHANYLVGMCGYVLLAGSHDMGWEQPTQWGFGADNMLMGDDVAAYYGDLEARWFLTIIGRQRDRLAVSHAPEAA